LPATGGDLPFRCSVSSSRPAAGTRVAADLDDDRPLVAEGDLICSPGEVTDP
jgi:hypothetical protein